MIKLIRKGTDGIKIIEVSNSAYENIFKRQGFVPFDSELPKSELPKSENTESANDETDEERVIRELESKPISQWSSKELKAYAEKNGLDASGKDLRTAVKEHLQNSHNAIKDIMSSLRPMIVPTHLRSDICLTLW